MNIDNYNEFINSVKLSFDELKKEFNIKGLIEFQSKHKYIFMLHHPGILKKMGNLIANIDENSFTEKITEIESLFEKLILVKPTIGSFINTSQHIFGYFSKNLTKEKKDSFFIKLELFKNSNLEYKVILKELYESALIFNNRYLLKQTIFDLVNSY
ncbi:YbgA family protein [bacterium]|nr:YbgA family protein [bacterium]